MSQENTNVEERPEATFERSKPREKFNNQPFPSDKSALNSKEWRQFLTSDEKTIVCVHPAKSVPFQDTKVLQIHTTNTFKHDIIASAPFTWKEY